MNALTKAPLVGEILPPLPADAPMFIQRSPFTAARAKHIELPEGSTLDLYVIMAMEELPEAYRPHLVVYIGEHQIKRELWTRVKPKAGQSVTVRVLPQGKTGKNILRAVIMIAIVAVAVTLLGPGSGFAVGLAASIGTVGAAVVSALAIAAVTYASLLALNALIPPPGLDSSSAKNRPFLTGGQNAWSPYGPIPRVFGKTRVYPVLAAHPYTEIAGKKQYLRMLLCVGWGPIKISDIRIGNTPLTAFTGVEYQVDEGGPSGWSGNTTTTLYNQQVRETPLNITLANPVTTSGQVSQLNTTEMSVDIAFPQGLITYTKKGEKETRTVNFLVEYRTYGSSGAWSTPSWLNTEDAETRPGGILRGQEQSQEAVVITGRWKVTNGQYEVRVTRQTAAGVQQAGGKNEIDTATWVVHRSVVDAAPVNIPGLTMIAIRIKASDQLQGMVQNINCLAEAYLPVYSGGTWTYTLTRNPAWAYADVLRRRGQEILLADNRIDIATIQSWATAAAANPSNDPTRAKWEFNGVIEGGSVFDAARRIAAIGRASFIIKDGKFSVARDLIQSTPIQHITPRNSWGYKGTKVFVDLPHALKIRFMNEAKDYQEDEVVVYADGYSAANATRFDTLELFGITNSNIAWQEGRYHLAVGSARPEEHSVSMDIEALRCTIGDRVQLTHDVILVGQAYGRVISNNASGGTVTLFTLDNEVIFEAGKTYQLRVRHPDGTSSLRTVTAPGGVPGTYTQVVTGESATGAPTADDLFMFGESGLESMPCIVKKVSPGSGDDLSVDLSLVAYDPAIINADTGTIPAFTSYISNPVMPEQIRPAAPILALRSNDSVIDVLPDGTVNYRIAADITPAGSSLSPVAEWEVQYRETGATVWKPASGTGRAPYNMTTIYCAPVRQGARYDVRARAISAYGVPSDWTEIDAHTVVGKTIAPDVPTLPSVSSGPRENYIRWTNGQDLDLAYVEVFASTTNDVLTTTSVGRTITGSFTHLSLTPGVVWYYWIRSVDYSGNASAKVSAGSGAAAAIASYDGIGADGNLSPVEKQTIIREFSDLSNEKSGLDTQAAALSVSVTTYDAAYAALNTYLASLTAPTAWNNTSGDTTIVRSTWNTKWSDLYAARQTLLNAIDAAAATRATWVNVRNSDPNAPVDNATRNVNTGTWVTSHAYLVGDIFQWNGTSYTVNTAHTSSGSSPDFTKVSAFAIAGLGAYSGNEDVTLPADTNGTVTGYALATGTFRVTSGSGDVSSSFTLSTAPGGNPQGLTVGYSGMVWSVTAGFAATVDEAALTIRATGSGAYTGVTIDRPVLLHKSKTGKLVVLYGDRSGITLDAAGSPAPSSQTTNFTFTEVGSTVPIAFSMTDAAGAPIRADSLMTFVGAGTAFQNAVPNSEDLSAATLVNCTATGGQAALDGSGAASAYRITGTGGGALAIGLVGNQTGSNSGNFRLQFWIKPETLKQFTFGDGSNGGWGGLDFTGTTPAFTTGASGTITALPNGVYYVEMTPYAGFGGTYGCNLYGGPSYPGSSTTGTFQIWGLQFVVGSTVRPYVRTKGGANYGVIGTAAALTAASFNTGRGSTKGVVVTAQGVDSGVVLRDVVSLNSTADGSNGQNSTRVTIFKRSATPSPTLPSVTTTYTFATAVLAGLNNGWDYIFPSTGTDPVYTSTAPASGTGATDSILASEWSTPPSLYVQNGDSGGFWDVKFIKSFSQPSAPTGATPTGWSDSIPSGPGGIWESRAFKAFDGTLLSLWSTPVQRDAILPRGPYDNTVTYYYGNLVTFNGGTYYATQDNFSGHAPSGTDQANSYWDVYAAPGSAGAPSTPPGAFSATINLTATDTNLRTVANANGYTGFSDATITFVVPVGVTIRGLAGGGTGLDTGSWPTSSYTIALTVQVNGTVDGGGGDGGAGGAFSSAEAGGAGGSAFELHTNLTGGITVNSGGVVRGGGGGGGGGGPKTNFTGGEMVVRGGGGGGGGFPNGRAGDAGGGDFAGSAGSAGTTSGGGSGGLGAGAAGTGGTGGGIAAAGFSGTSTSTSGGDLANQGAAGYAVRKRGFTATVTNSGGTLTGTVG